MEDLQKRVEALEVGSTFDASQAAVQEAQMDMLTKLRDIRQAMEQSGGSASSKEMEALRQENAALKQKVAKQQYRIQHLVDAVEELVAKREKV
jgi:FtsZ-binding cell division protein ZapB